MVTPETPMSGSLFERWIPSLLLAGLALGWSSCLPAQSDNNNGSCRKGSYSNESYLYSIALPNGISCCQDPPPGGIHGCGIALSRSSKLWVDGSYNALDYNSAEDALLSVVESDLIAGTTLTVLRREPTKLGGFEAVRLTLRIKKQGEVETRISDRVTAIASREGGRGGVVYTVGFNGPEAEYSKYKKIFSQIFSSWKAEAAGSK